MSAIKTSHILAGEIMLVLVHKLCSLFIFKNWNGSYLIKHSKSTCFLSRKIDVLAWINTIKNIVHTIGFVYYCLSLKWYFDISDNDKHTNDLKSFWDKSTNIGISSIFNFRLIVNIYTYQSHGQFLTTIKIPFSSGDEFYASTVWFPPLCMCVCICVCGLCLDDKKF